MLHFTLKSSGRQGLTAGNRRFCMESPFPIFPPTFHSAKFKFTPCNRRDYKEPISAISGFPPGFQLIEMCGNRWKREELVLLPRWERRRGWLFLRRQRSPVFHDHPYRNEKCRSIHSHSRTTFTFGKASFSFFSPSLLTDVCRRTTVSRFLRPYKWTSILSVTCLL